MAWGARKDAEISRWRCADRRICRSVSSEKGRVVSLKMATIQGHENDVIDFRMWGVEDLAWSAGFIDGDGMISFFRRRDRRQEFYVQVSATNTNLAPLEKLQLMFGGSICGMNKEKPGKKWKASWYWMVARGTAERVIDVLLPYLVAKHEQAMLAKKARQFVGKRWQRRSPETISELHCIEQEFRKLNRKGVNHGLSH